MIGVAPGALSELPTYTEWLEKRSFQYRVLKPEDTLEDCKVLLLCGGADIGKNIKRDEREIVWFNAAYQNIPILGICRGMQLANIILGGTLIQDIENQNHRAMLPSKKSKFHRVNLLTSETIIVNSRHHQALDRVAEGLNVIGYSTDGIPEIAVGNKSMFIQWHPEREEVFNTDAELICYKWLKSNI